VRKRTITVLAAGVTALAAGIMAAAAPAGSAATRPDSTAGSTAPGIITKPGAVRVGTATQSPPTTAFCVKNFRIDCFSPLQIRTAYNLAPVYANKVTGKGETIVIVDSFGSPTIAHDLGVFDKAYGLPAPPSLKVITPAGAIRPWNANNSDMTGWAGETTLDVEWAHAIAPGASILLVETPVSETEGVTGFPQIVEAEDYVLAHHLGDVISQSFSATEETFGHSPAQDLATINKYHLRAAYVRAAHDGVTVLTASGDSGVADVGLNESTYFSRPVTSWPDSDPLVTGVGGTQVIEGGNHNYTQVAWNDTYNTTTQGAIFGNAGPNPLAGGGGLSVLFSRPSYQSAPAVQSVVGTQRGVPDISMSGSCSGAVNTYQSFPETGVPAGWYPVCGTSEATPEFAGIVALADQVAHHSLGLINATLYTLSAEKQPGIVDITKGDNGVSFTQGNPPKTTMLKGFDALKGYDLATGVGTVNAKYFVYELAHKNPPK
jgi:subtilase family serine protease